MAKSDRSSLVLAEETSKDVPRENKDAAPLTRSDLVIIIIGINVISKVTS